MGEDTIQKFCYSDEDFIYSTSTWEHFKEKRQLSEFDRLICDAWDKGQQEGIFRYKLTDLKSRVVPGKEKYILQLNLKRSTERRKPEHISSLSQPFDPSKFDFTRVKVREIVCQLVPKCEVRQNGCISADRLTKTHPVDRHLVVVNVSPLEYGHVLLTPQVDHFLPQRLTEKAIQKSIEMMLLSSHPGWRVGFNGLCALASVNHQHLHGWYLEESIPLEHACVKPIHSLCHEMIDMPTRAFAFQLHGSEINHLAREIFFLTNYLQENEIAHNLFMTRGPIFGEGQGHHLSTVRIYVWPRVSVIGAKGETAVTGIFNVAVAELAGHIPMYDDSRYDDITEDEIKARIAEFLLPDDKFNDIRDAVKRLLSNVKEQDSR